jgi:hypothetical protein
MEKKSFGINERKMTRKKNRRKKIIILGFIASSILVSSFIIGVVMNLPIEEVDDNSSDNNEENGGSGNASIFDLFERETGYIRPNEDIRTEFEAHSEPHYRTLLYSYGLFWVRPRAGLGVYLTDTYGMETTNLSGKHIVEIQCMVSVRTDFVGSGGLAIYGNLVGMNKQEISLPTWTAWRTITWSGLWVNQTEFDDIEISLEGWSYLWNYVMIWELYLNMTMV